MSYYTGQTSPDMQWRNRKKRNDQEHHERVSFFHLGEFKNVFFCFVFEKISSLLPIMLVTLFGHVGKRSNSCS